MPEAVPTDAAVVPCHCQALRQAARRVSALYDAALAAHGLRVSQYAVLARLHADGPRGIQALADALAMDRTTLGRALRPLERDGLVRLARDPSDARQRRLALTDRGCQRLARAQRAWAAAQARFEQGFGRDRAVLLHHELSAVQAAATIPPAAR
jgi:DNA-binding MarR family transcriptional regulator